MHLCLLFAHLLVAVFDDHCIGFLRLYALKFTFTRRFTLSLNLSVSSLSKTAQCGRRTCECNFNGASFELLPLLVN